MAKQNWWSKLAEGITAPVGGTIQGTTRGLFPGWAGSLDRRAQAQMANIELAKQKQKLEQDKFDLAGEEFDFLKKTSKKGQKNTRLSRLMEIIKDPRPPEYGGFSPTDKKAAGDEIRRMLLKNMPQGITGGWSGTPQAGVQAGGALGGIGIPGGMIPEKVETDKGYPVTTYGQEFAKPSGAYQYIPEAERPEVARQSLTKPMVEIRPAAAERTQIAEGRASLDSLNNLKALFDSTQTKTGPIAGRTQPTLGLFGMTTNEQESFMAATSAFKNAIIKEITGAQMSEQEANRIMKQVPDITDPKARWIAKWEQSKKNLEMLQKRRMEILEQSGMRVPQGLPQKSDSINKPANKQFFLDEVSRLNTNEGGEAARKYYEQWIDSFDWESK